MNCSFCGREAFDERDHVPAKCIFPEPRSSDLITVPACRACNGGRSKHDEWFKQLLLMRADLRADDSLSALRESVYRSWKRPESAALAASWSRAIRNVSIRSPGGLHLGKASAIMIDEERLIAYLSRLVRGLFYEEVRERLPDDVQITASTGFEIEKDIQRDALEMLGGRPIRSVANGVFRYAWNFVPEDKTSSIWILEFYRRVSFSAVTVSELARKAVGDAAV